MKSKHEYSIAIGGLPAGKHFFSFKIGDAFFVDFEGSEVQQAEIEAAITVIKNTGLVQLEVQLTGHVIVPCDRCLDDLTVPVAFHGTPVVKFTTDSDNPADDNVLWTNIDADKVDLTQYLYDSIILSLPLQRTHDVEKCNKDMIEKLNKLIILN
ncbi:MAG: DUF177 domain-containing protein [Prevotellaceae bacterium]|nr:DUF177 domain-containing protein [Prevotellaceae bacterium]